MTNAIRAIVPFGQHDPDDGFVITDLLHVVTIDADWNEIARFVEALTGVGADTFGEHGNTVRTRAITPGRFLASLDSGWSGTQTVAIDAVTLGSNDPADADRAAEEDHPDYTVDSVSFEHPASAFIARLRAPMEPLENGQILVWANSGTEAVDVMIAAVPDDYIIENVRPATRHEAPVVTEGVIRTATNREEPR